MNFGISPRDLSVAFAAVQDPSLTATATAELLASAMRSNGAKRQRTTSISDTTAYQQWKRYSVRDGRRRKKLMPLLASNLTRLDYLFKGLKDFQGSGFYPMSYNAVTNANDANIDMPIYVFRLNSVIQYLPGSSPQVAIPSPLRRLSRRSGGLWTSNVVNGHSPDGSSSPSLQYVGNNLATGAATIDAGAMGPKGYLNWTSLKLNLWGAKYKQVKYVIEICRPLDADCNIYRYSPNSNLHESLSQHLDEMMRPLTVNPLATANNLTPSPWKVLKRVYVELDPIQMNEGDQDPHCKTVTLFNRWGRIYDYQDSLQDSTPEADDYANYVDPQRGIMDAARTVNLNNVAPTLDTDNLFVVIRSNCFSRSVGIPFDNTNNASFDLSFRSSFSKLQ